VSEVDVDAIAASRCILKILLIYTWRSNRGYFGRKLPNMMDQKPGFREMI
jgi:hypothetical protein